ncbi:MAG: hypothetical protein V4721_06700 [Bacteroidota bacterium]
MSKLQQNVCDAILFYTEAEYPDINRSGSTKGTQNVIKGRPDSYFLLDNGKYVLVEYTTQSKQENKSANADNGSSLYSANSKSSKASKLLKAISCGDCPVNYNR